MDWRNRLIQALVEIASLGPEYSPSETDGENPTRTLARLIEIRGFEGIVDDMQHSWQRKLILQANDPLSHHHPLLFLSWPPGNCLQLQVGHDAGGRYLPAARRIEEILDAHSLLEKQLTPQ